MSKSFLNLAREKHDPERYEGRSWDELSLFEQEAAILVVSGV